MSTPSPARYRMTNWSRYNASLLILVGKKMTWHAPHEGRPGRLPVFSNATIRVCLSIKVLFNRPLRQIAGMAARLPKLAGPGWPVPGPSTLSRRPETPTARPPKSTSASP